MAFRKKREEVSAPEDPLQAKLDRVRTAVDRFVSVTRSNGGADEYLRCRAAITEVGLAPSELRVARLRLPVVASVEAGRRLQIIEKMLLEMEG